MRDELEYFRILLTIKPLIINILNLFYKLNNWQNFVPEAFTQFTGKCSIKKNQKLGFWGLG